jgi:hypothetical protein
MFDADIAGYVFNKIISKDTKLIFKVFYVIMFILIILSFIGALWVGINFYIQ